MKKTIATLFISFASLATAQTVVEIPQNTTKTDNSVIILKTEKDTVYNSGQYNVQKIQIENGNVTNFGTITEIFEDEYNTYSDLLHILAAGGNITNYGRIEGRTTVVYGSFTAMDGSYMTDFDLYDGGSRLNVIGNVTVNGILYSEEDAEIIFTLGGSINMMGNDLETWGTKIVLLLDDTITSGDTTTSYRYLEKNNLFTNVGNGALTGDTTIILRDAQGNETTRKYSELSTVPEPTTATLTLLALTCLAARRRRVSR